MISAEQQFLDYLLTGKPMEAPLPPTNLDFGPLTAKGACIPPLQIGWRIKETLPESAGEIVFVGRFTLKSHTFHSSGLHYVVKTDQGDYDLYRDDRHVGYLQPLGCFPNKEAIEEFIGSPIG